MTVHVSYNFLVFFKNKRYPTCVGMAGDFGELTISLWDKNRLSL